MKKIIIMFVMVLSGFVFAQESTDNPFIYDNGTTELQEEDVLPANPGDPAPIDDYIPVLLIIAIGLAIAFANKKKTA